ncbi:MAG: hypothetical protein V3U57_01590 [Robiginitomaculum sp.]
MIQRANEFCVKRPTSIVLSGLGRKVALCLSLGFFVPMPAFAQDVQSSDVDKPVSASPVQKQTVQLPALLKPEVLSVFPMKTIDPASVKRRRAASLNSWDPATLTQTTGLGASTVRASARRAVPSSVKADVMPTDVLNLETLLGVNFGIKSIKTSFLTLKRYGGVSVYDGLLRGALFETAGRRNVNESVFKLDLGKNFCLGMAEECEANITDELKLGFAKNINSGKVAGVNLQLTLRAGMRFDEDSNSARVGAVVRIGDNLRKGSETKPNTWYFFAGKNAEAMTYRASSVRRLTNGQFHLQDRIIVGGAQAGLGYKIGGADLALTYYKRQAKVENYKFDEDAAALSITWKR